MAGCKDLLPEVPDQTDAQLAETYRRWLRERDCLMGLGYAPLAPDSLEKFIADWRTSGPWMPIDGVDVHSWTAEEYDAAKTACGLEMLTR